MVEPVGSLYGYKIVLRGMRDIPGVPRARRLPSGLVAVTGDRDAIVNAQLAPFSLDSIVSLTASVTAARLTRYEKFAEGVAQYGWDPQVTFLPFTLRRLVLEAIRRRPLPDVATRSIAVRDLLRAEEAVWDHLPAVDLAAGKSQDEIQALALRTLQAQYSDQLGYVYYQQELSLALDTVGEAKRLGCDLDGMFRMSYGLTFSDMAFASFALFSTVAAKSPAQFDLGEVNKSGDIKGLTPDIITAFWGHCAATYEAFQAHAQSPAVRAVGYEAYAMSPSVHWPLTIRNDGLAVAPIAADLLNRPIHGFVVDALQAIDRCDPMKRGSFNLASGRAFERYVGRTLEATEGAGTVLAADDVFSKRTKHCDRVCVDGRRVLLVEAKAPWFHLRADMTKERSALKAELARDGSLAGAIEQLDESAIVIRSRKTDLPKNAHLMGLLVVKGDEVGLNSPYVAELLSEILAERGRAKPIIKIQIVNDVGFSSLAQLHATDGSMWKFVRDKHEDDAHRYNEMHFQVEEASQVLPDHPLAQSFEERFVEMASRYDDRFARDMPMRRAELSLPNPSPPAPPPATHSSPPRR